MPSNWAEDMGDLREETYALLDFMRVCYLTNDKYTNSDDYIDLHYDTLQDIIPNFYKSQLLNKLLNKGILERTTIDQIKMQTIDGGEYYLEAERGLERHRAYGYRLANPDYRNSKWTLRDLTKSSLLSKIKKHINCKYPVQRWLMSNNSRLQVRETAPDDKALQLIRNRRWNNTFDCFGGRYYNNITNLKKELRKFLMVDGESLCEIDYTGPRKMDHEN